jgi:hypothetical protein
MKLLKIIITPVFALSALPRAIAETIPSGFKSAMQKTGLVGHDIGG